MTAPNPTVWLTLQAHNAPELIDFYIETFGFVVAARYGDGDRVDHAQLNWPEGIGGVMLGSHKPGTNWCREPGSAGGYVVTNDPQALYERVLSHKAEIVRPLAKTDYGANEFAVRDPEGNLWSFGDYTGEPMPG
ncbi:VOC family protein [Mycobacterium malmoense]|uniref:Glyoxalase n=1 Tax=Mycobacterium malmoense TaxID=1780 RepID=A0ABX3SXI1_MYCMA|nr:VOC family protein [Mycobacterium malmoense]ORA85407.1 glyoxalase [Mycobacterium malmoense]QZA17768.1 VOC family protein [Mycobacterium malmoense]UNB94548.1 VOC family protein [Mycobacterium malmoense]